MRKNISQITGRIKGRRKIENYLSALIADDRAFREVLLKNPAKVISQAFEITIPQGIQIKIHQETENTAYLVLPFFQEIPGGIREFSDAELEEVSGGSTAPASLIDILANHITRFTSKH